VRAMILNDKALRVGAIADPEPGPGQVLVKSLACGVCASDLHLQAHGARLAEWSRRFGGPFSFEPRRDLVMGHEFCGEIEDYGPQTARVLPVGARVTSVPTLFHRGGMAVLGYDNDFPGGFAQRMLLSERLLLRVPDALSTEAAALTEPVSVGFPYARIANPAPGDVPLVVGCGMIGLAVIAALRHAGVTPIVASDFSAPRRALAARAGASEVVDPARESPFDVWKRAARSVKGAKALIFECVGVPGVLGPILEQAPWFARVVVAGACLEPDTLFTAAAHTKAINVQFGGMPIPEDFARALRALGDGAVDVEPWLTGRAGLEDSVAAFERAKDANAHARMILRPNE
jgi:threonine dehydrogenase-like Zn-dependent dehydrogenase